MVSVFTKTIFHTIGHKWVRFLVNAAIMMTSITFAAGLGNFSDTFRPAIAAVYEEGRVPDVILKSTSTSGFNVSSTNSDLSLIKGIDNVEEVYYLFSADLPKNDEKSAYLRLTCFEFPQSNNEAESNASQGMAIPTLKEGNMPGNIQYEFGKVTIDALLQTELDGTTTAHIGDIFPLNLKALVGDSNPLINAILSVIDIRIRITGFADSPMYNSTITEIALTEDAKTNPKYVEQIFFGDFSKLGIFKLFLPHTDMYVRMKERGDYFTDTYKRQAETLKNACVAALGGEEKAVGLILEDNVSYASYRGYDGKIRIIGLILPILFVLVCALVQSVIIGRLIADERSTMGCYFSLGVKKSKIVGKYLVFTLLSSLIGGSIGYFFGAKALPYVVAPAYQSVFKMKVFNPDFMSPAGIMMFTVLIIVTIAITFWGVLASLHETPESLLKPKAPKPGKKIWLERIKPLWKRLPFSLKSNCRNIFRHKKNLILTTLSVIGSEVLVFLGFALSQNMDALTNDPTSMFRKVAPSMQLISFVVIAFGVVLCMLVIYALSSLNVDERMREIAVLKVIGYHDLESASFAMRELLMISLVASLLGIPVSMGVVSWIFDLLDLGSLWNTQWYSYIGTILLIMGAALLSCAILYPKIKKIDFNLSLKSVE